jgi:predicted nucleic acid-binding protein
MRCIDSSFLIDLMRAVPLAVEKASHLEKDLQVLAIPSPCVAELIRGANLGGPKERRQTEELLDQLEILPLDGRSARAAGQIAAECATRGRDVPLLDCLIAAIARLHDATLITRDPDFARIPGLAVETY